jgi:hypothetical protein
MSFCDKSMTYDISKHLKPDLAFRTVANSRPLSHLFNPISEDESRKCATHTLTHKGLAAEEETASLLQLKNDLDAHFQVLKREFEVKRGVAWTPLQSWAHEEWEWDDEGCVEAHRGLDW